MRAAPKNAVAKASPWGRRRGSPAPPGNARTGRSAGALYPGGAAAPPNSVIRRHRADVGLAQASCPGRHHAEAGIRDGLGQGPPDRRRSEEHTSELQSRENLVCRLLLEKKKN